MADQIIVVHFTIESEAYQAFSEVKASPVVQGSYQVHQSVIVKKEAGQIVIKDSFDTGSESYDDMVKGGLIGGLVGMIGGPVGVLVGGSIGTFIGNSLDANDVQENSSMIEQVGNALADGAVTLISLVKEKEEGSFNAAFDKFSTYSFLRIPKEELMAKIKEEAATEK